MSLPATITLTQVGLTPALVLADGPVQPPPVPEYYSNLVVGDFSVGQTVSSGMGVMQTAGGVAPGAVDTLAEAVSFLGVAQQAGNPGGTVAVVSYGPISDTSFNWTLDEPIFLSDAGVLTQAPPQAGVSLIVGFPLSATEMFVRPSLPLQL